MLNETIVVAEIRRVIGNPKNQCYAASEAAYHLLEKTGYTPCVASFYTSEPCDFNTHWWLRRADGSVLDITAGQFAFPFPYVMGRGCGFLTKQPSKKAQEIIDAVQERRTNS